MSDHNDGPKRLGGLPEIIPTDAQAIGAPRQDASENFANSDPRDINRRLESRVRALCGGQFRTNVSSRFNGEMFSHSVVEGLDWDLPVESRGKVRELLARVTKPAPDRMIIAALYDLRKITISRERESTEEGKAAESEVWLRLLAKYPADVAVHTLREWTQRVNGRFWPTWHELEQILRSKSSIRTVIAAKLDREP